MKLTSSQRRKLKALAHPLNPVVQVGQKGLSETMLEEIEIALLAHELIKVRFQEFKGEKASMAARIEEASGAVLVDIIGHVAILYRPHPNPEQRTIQPGK